VIPSALVELADDRFARHGVRVLLKRDDLIDPDLPGNKWRKLKYNVAPAQQAGTLLTFGGAYSNHLRAAAAAGRRFGFATIGVVRGEEHRPLNPSLSYAAAQGMHLTYLDRTTYRRKHSAEVGAALRARFGDFYLLPEGGSNARAVHGCAELPAEITADFDVIATPCGTGGTLAGIAAGLRTGQRAIGFSALRGGEFLAGEVAALHRDALGYETGNWTIEYDFHFGGYARSTPELAAFRADFAGRHGVELDRIYVAKMMFGLLALVERGSIAANSTVVAVITGPP
jgi:1-aminocyclopropane-1-carboxylate deaminase